MPEMSPVDPSKAVLLDEQDDTYRLFHPHLGEFDVSKNGIADDTHAFIKSLKAPQSEANDTEPGAVTEPAVEATTPEKLVSEPPAQAQASTEVPSVESEIKQALPDYGKVSGPGLPTTAATQATPKTTSSYDQETKAVQEIADAQKKAAEEQVKAYKSYETEYLTSMKLMQDRFNARQADRQRIEEGLRRGTVDGNRFWSEGSIPKQALAAFSIILGGIGQGLMKSGSNPALDVINRVIDRDIEAQKEKLKNNKEMLELFNKDENDIRDQKLTHAKMMLEMAKARSVSPIEQANADRQIALIKRAQEQNDAARATEALQAGGFGLAGSPGGFGQLPAQTQLQLSKSRVVLPDGSSGFISNPEKRQEIQNKVDDIAEALDWADKLEAFAKENKISETDGYSPSKLLNRFTLPQDIPAVGGKGFETAFAENARELQNKAADALRKVKGGRDNKLGAEKYREAIPDFARANTKEAFKDLNEFRQDMREEMERLKQGNFINYQSYNSVKKPGKP